MIHKPGSTIGIVGGGQLGRMLAMAAARLGYRCHIYSPEEDCPAAQVAARFTRGGFDDAEALRRFAAEIDVATFEFENIATAALDTLACAVPLHPPVRALATAQDRLTEKRFVADFGGRTAPFRAVDDLASLESAVAAIGCPAILKTRRFGYDGKGQARLTSPDRLAEAWEDIRRQPAVLEGLVVFDDEFSIILCRAADGACVSYEPPRNRHKDGILAASTLPAGPAIKAQQADALALSIGVAAALDYVGVLTLEFFAAPGGPVFNEMAPRVHNSGHWTIEGAATSQFENHIRAVCGLPLGNTGRLSGAVEMRNLIGPEADDWPALLAAPGAHLHLYGKDKPRPGRKMGHVTTLSP